MAKRNRNQHKKQQRALQKRTKRKRKLARKQSQNSVGVNPRKLLRTAREFSVEGAWAQREWQSHGIAHILFARTQPNDDIIFGEYLVDYRCMGIRNASYSSNIDRESFYNSLIPYLYQGEPPIDLETNLAHEIIWGAVEYAEGFGFDPPRRFQDASLILEPADALPRNGNIEFGHAGDPLYAPFPDDDQAAVIRKLIYSVGLGNFYYVPPGGNIPPDVVELMEAEMEKMGMGEEAEESSIWTPDLQSQGVDAQSGLWVPGQSPGPEREDEQAEQPALWTPGRS